ncbi:MAG: peptidoglycan-binding domain-containing protein [Hyphomicrobiales bacterium]
MKVNLKRHVAVLGSVIFLGTMLPNAAHAQNPFESFFNNIGRSVKGAAEALTPNRRKRQQAPAPQPDLTNDLDGDTTTAPAQPKVVADPVLRSTQSALNKLGYNAGKPDGLYGKRTANAIRQFQASLGHNQTGRLKGEERDVLFDQARNPTKYAVKAPAAGTSAAAGSASQTIQAQDAGLKDSLPSSTEGAYFDADEPEEENVPPQPAGN